MSRLSKTVRSWWHGKAPPRSMKMQERSPSPQRAALESPAAPPQAEREPQPERFYYKPHVCWLVDREWLAPYEACIAADATGGQPATRILDRRFTLVQFAKSIQHLPGSTAEAGVCRGVGSALICKALEGTYRAGQTHWGFDSFEGLPAPDARDRSKLKEYDWWKRGSLSVDEATTRSYLSPYSPCRIEKGWIPDCLQPARDCQFRFVHIDVDLAAPTTDCLAFFYPRMVPNSVILFDDYGFSSCPGARSAADEFFADKPEQIIELATGQAFVIKAA